MKSIILLTLLSLAIQSHANKKNELWMHNSTLNIKADSSWVIIAHHPFGSRSSIAFQILDNEAEKGTPDSTNLVISTYDFSDIQNLLDFTKAVQSKPQEGEVDTNYEGWVIRTWSGSQGETKYTIADARTTNKATGLGIHVRLAWPLLKDNPKNYDQTMKMLLESVMSQINKSHPEPQTK